MALTLYIQGRKCNCFIKHERSKHLEKVVLHKVHEQCHLLGGQIITVYKYHTKSMNAQRDHGISILDDIQKLPEHGSGQGSQLSVALLDQDVRPDVFQRSLSTSVNL